MTAEEFTDTASSQSIPQTGLACLVLLLRIQGIPVDPGQIAHQYGNTIGTTEMLRCAKDLKLKARSYIACGDA